jgi:hypothetical protein
MLRFKLAMVVAFGLALAQSVSATVIVQNGGFDDLTIPGPDPEYFVYNSADANPLSVPGWTLQDANGSNVAVGILTPQGISHWQRSALSGAQMITMGSGNGGWFEQTISGLSNGTFSVNFSESGYGGSWTGTTSVTLDGTALTFGGSPTVSRNATSWQAFTSDSINISAGPHTLRFTNADLGDYDKISISGTSTPEPGTCVLLVTGLFGLLAYAWRKRK